MLVGGHGECNPNTVWLQSRGLWLSYIVGVLALHLILLSVPLLTIPMAWTLTNLIHNCLFIARLAFITLSYESQFIGVWNWCHLVFLHIIKGAPWIPQDQGYCRSLTHWEQIDYGCQFTSTRKFLTVVPIVLFILTSFYTRYDTYHFIINFISLIVVVVPKLPQFHEVRLFGINKY